MWYCGSAAASASTRPVRPPQPNRTTKPTANSIGVSKLSEPRQMVAIQQKNSTARGSEISMVLYMKYSWPPVDMPLVNMW